MKNVLIVSAKNLTRGGVEAFLMNWIKQSHKLDIIYTWVVPGVVIDEEYSEEFRKFGVNIFAIGESRNNIRRIISLYKYLYLICKSNNFDIIHVNSGGLFINVSALATSKLTGIKGRIAHSHSSGAIMKNGVNKIANPLLRFIINHCATKKVACSMLAAEALFGKKHVKDAVIIPNCIDSKRFAFSKESRRDIRTRYGLDGCFVVGQVARLSPEKNQKFIMDILKELLKKDMTARVLFVGDGPIKRELVEYAAQLGINEFVIFVGSSQKPEMFYSAMDVFLLPSKYEGLGIVNIEAQASGLYCIVSENVPREVNITGHMSFLPLSASTNEWTDEILRAKNNVSGSRDESCQVVSNSKYDLSALEQYIENIYE